MPNVIGVTAPIYLLIALGYVALRRDWLTPEQLAGLGGFVMRFALPCLIFHALAQHTLADLAGMTYFIAYGGGSLLAYGISFFIAFSLRRQSLIIAALNGFGASFSNTGFIGYSVLAMVIGQSAGIYLAYNTLIENLLMVPLFLLMAESAGQKGNPLKRFGKIILGLLKKPVILGLLAGLSFTISGYKPPQVLMTLSSMLANAAAPLALFFIGGSLSGLRIRGSLPDITQISLGKLLLHPLLVLGLLWLLRAPAEMRFAGVLLAAMPVGTMLPLFGQYFGYQRRCAAALMAATTFSFLTISLLLLFTRP